MSVRLAVLWAGAMGGSFGLAVASFALDWYDVGFFAALGSAVALTMMIAEISRYDEYAQYR